MLRLAVLLAALIPAVAGATDPARDNFDRASLGGNWTSTFVSVCGECTIASNALVSDGAGADAVCFWNPDTFATSQYACAHLGGTAGGFAGACVAMDSQNAVCCETMATHGWEMDVYQNAAALGPQATGTDAFAVGDYIGIQRNDPNTYRCYRSTNGLTWVGLGTAATLSGFPQPGATGAANNAAGFTITEWEGGTGILPTTTPCGSVPMTTLTTVTTSTTMTTLSTTTTTSTSSTTTPSSPTTSTTAVTSTTTTTTTTTSTTVTTTTTTTTSTLPAPPLAPSNLAGSATNCITCAFTWTNAADPLLAQTCVGPNGCLNIGTASCVKAPATATTLTQPAGTARNYFACSVDIFGQMSANSAPVLVTTPTCASTSTTTTTTLVPSSVCGDVDNDGRVSIGDALAISFYVSGQVKCTQAMKIPGNCDVNHDNHCTAADAAAIQACLIAHNCGTALHCGNFHCPNKDATVVERDRHLGTIWYRDDRIRSGPVHFDDLVAYGSGPGTWVWCDDCFPTAPATGPGGPGAHCFHDATEWNCISGTSPCGESCPAGTILSGIDGNCNVQCTPCSLDCQNGGTCVFCGTGQCCICPPEFCGGLCQEMCEPPTTTTSTTSSTTVTTSTTATTSTTVAGTTTTSSTTATTTTTLAVVASTTFEALPNYPMSEVEGTYPQGGVAQRPLLCGRFMATHTMTGITKMAGKISSTTGFASRASFSLYPDNDSGTLLASIDGIDSANFGAIVYTNTSITPFTLTRGTMYRVCTCCGYNAIIDTCPKYESVDWLANGFAAEQNVFVTSVGKGNACGGDPGLASPSTTGPLTPDASIKPPIIFLSVE